MVRRACACAFVRACMRVHLSGLVWSGLEHRAVWTSLEQFGTLRAICVMDGWDGMGLVIPEQSAYKSHRRAVLITTVRRAQKSQMMVELNGKNC